MQFTEHADHVPVQAHRGRAPRMQGGMRERGELQLARREQRLEIALHVVKVDAARALAPLLGHHLAGRQRGDVHHLMEAAHRLAIGLALEHACHLENAHAVDLALAIGGERADQARNQAGAHIGLARRIGFSLAQKSRSQASSTKAKLTTSW